MKFGYRSKDSVFILDSEFNGPSTSIERLCLGVDDHVSLNDGFESDGQWDRSEFRDTADSGTKKETKAFTFYQMETEEMSERYITPCFVSGLHAYDGQINLEYEKNMTSNEFAIKLLLDCEEKDGENFVKKELLVALKGEIYFVKFIINPEEDDVEPGVVLGRSFLRLSKGIVDFGNGIISIYPDLDSFNDDSDDDWEAILDSVDVSDLPQLDVTDVPSFVCNMGKRSRNKKRSCRNYKMSYYDEGPSLTVKKPLTQEEFSDQHKKLLDSVLLDKLKLDGEVELAEEASTKEVIRSYKAIKEKNDLGFFVLPILIEAKFDFHALADTGSNINVVPYRIYAKLGRHQVKPFYVAQVRNKHGESDSDNEEEYYLKRDNYGKPFYGPNRAKYLSCDDSMDRALALQEALNPFKKICVWKKMIAFLGSLPVPLKNSEWIPNYSDNFSKKGGEDGKWHAKVRIVEPYGNVFDQGYETRATERKLLKHYKLSDIMSPD
ncbi:hypothetical protein Tco_0195908 [Tanacetum coccineum]